MASHRPHKCNVTSCGKEFKLKAHLTRHCANSHGVAMRSGSPRPIMKTRAAFYFSAISSLQQARRICSDVLNLKRGARNPFMPLNLAAFKQECNVHCKQKQFVLLTFVFYRFGTILQRSLQVAQACETKSWNSDGHFASTRHTKNAQARVVDCFA